MSLPGRLITGHAAGVLRTHAIREQDRQTHRRAHCPSSRTGRRNMMAKQQALCPVCRGSYDGTPSGRRRHDDSQVHRLAEATIEVGLATAAATLDPISPTYEPMTDESLGLTEADQPAVEVAKANGAEVVALQKQLKARTADLRWREARQDGDPNAKASSMAGQRFTAAQVQAARDKVAAIQALLREDA